MGSEEGRAAGKEELTAVAAQRSAAGAFTEVDNLEKAQSLSCPTLGACNPVYEAKLHNR